MARCVLSLVNQGFPEEGVACMVHTAYAPCTHDGEPANPEPIHADDLPARADVLSVWKLRTGGQRPLFIHRGSLDGTHTLAADCWCEPELVAAAEVAG